MSTSTIAIYVIGTQTESLQKDASSK